MRPLQDPELDSAHTHGMDTWHTWYQDMASKHGIDTWHRHMAPMLKEGISTIHGTEYCVLIFFANYPNLASYSHDCYENIYLATAQCPQVAYQQDLPQEPPKRASGWTRGHIGGIVGHIT